MNELTKKKSRASLITSLLIIFASAAVYFHFFYKSYSDSRYFVIEGQKPANLKLFLEVGYGSNGKNCEHYSIGTGGTYQESDHKEYEAEVTKNGTYYRFRYPIEYKRRGCDFSSGFAKIKSKLFKTSDLVEPYDREIDGVLVSEDAPSKYFDIAGVKIWENKNNDLISNNSPKYNQERVDYFCQRWVMFPNGPKVRVEPFVMMDCSSFYENISFNKSNVIYTLDYIKKLSRATLNIKLDDGFQCFACPDAWKEKGYKTIDEEKKPDQQFFKEFDK